jgi:mycothiol synthase
VTRSWSVLDALSVPDRTDVDDFLARIARAHGEALTADQRARLAGPAQVRHVLRRQASGSLSGYALLVDGPVIDAEAAFGTYDADLAKTLEGLGKPVALWVREVTDDQDAVLASRGWRRTRSLLLLGRPLPAPSPDATVLDVRSFRPGIDDEEWIAENNAAFATHPTQGSMTLGRLRAIMREPWFDPEGFLLFFDGGDLVASCWTKIFRRGDVDEGEIFVISVAPSGQGRGLGRLAVLSGLDHLARRGVGDAELYVEDSNAGAIRLYASLGFTFRSRDAEYRFDPAR